MSLARWQSTIVDEDGDVLPSASVTVRKESNGALATLFSDRAGVTGVANPRTADGDGFVFFYVRGGSYKITATLGAVTKEWRHVAIGTAAELDTADIYSLTGIRYAFATSTSAGADAGTIRANNASLASATALYFADDDAEAVDNEAYLAAVGNSDSTVRGHVRLHKPSSGENEHIIFSITGAATNGSGFVTVPVTYVSGALTLAAGDDIVAEFLRTGDKGDDGADGTDGADGADGDVNILPSAPQGRLSLASGAAITTSDVVAATTVYYALSTGNLVPIYDGTEMVPTIFTELSLALDGNSGHTNYHQVAKNFDFFVINDGGTVRLGTGPKWDDGAVAGSDVARGTGAASTELEMKFGIWTNKNTITIRFGSASGNTVSVPANRATYVGTGFMQGAHGQIDDSKVKRFLWNAYNRAPRTIRIVSAAANWNYSSAAFQVAAASVANQFEMVRGLNEDPVRVDVQATFFSSGAAVRSGVVGVGLDDPTVNTARNTRGISDNVIQATPTAVWEGYPGLGWHYLAWLERGAGVDTQTWIGTTATGESGMGGLCWA